MNKWEYCVLTGVMVPTKGNFSGHYPHLFTFSNSGISEELDLTKKGAATRPEGWEKATESEYIAAKISELGMQGWEMVGMGTGIFNIGDGGAHCIYFKRPMA
ncbi:MAG: hypothetical protein JEZ00_13745 [Anaerolineaceae bacterium]|nr:hypothetical protein [Anaerolineaceae bacterium]